MTEHPVYRAAVLCPGPSLVETYAPREGEFQLVIGVNRAVGRFRCHSWVMLDARTFRLVVPVGQPVIVASRAVYKLACASNPDAVRHAFLAHRPGLVPTDEVRWNAFGSTTAIELAARLGARQIDVFGMDMAGDKDFDGYCDDRQDRTTERWAREGRTVQELFAALAKRGVSCHRYTAGSKQEVSA